MSKIRLGAIYVLLLISAFSNSSGGYVGMNIGAEVSNPLSAVKIVTLLKERHITHIRLQNADAHMLQALGNTGIEVMVSVTNAEVLGIGRLPASAAAWVNTKIVPYVPSTNITAIAVGNEILTKAPHVAPALVPAMKNLHTALVALNLNFVIKVSAPQSMDLIPRPFPPSVAIFEPELNSTIYNLLQFLKHTGSYFTLNVYPYYGYIAGNGVFPLDFALFRPLPRAKQIVDPNTLLRYSSMFDAMVDAAYFSIQACNFSEIPIIVTETGWPWMGRAKEPDMTVENAETYNSNLIRRVLNSSGPPSMPSTPISVYVYELLNEDKRPGPAWGLYFANGSEVYPLSLENLEQSSGNSSLRFCVAKAGADADKLLEGIDWACGQGHANCSAIQPGQPCYLPNTIENHASYAYNDYYQRMKSAGGSCDFSGTATTTFIDPSHGSCKFAGRSDYSSTYAALAPLSAFSGNSVLLPPSFLALLIMAALLVTLFFV